MKAVATLFVLIVASCATGSDPETSTAEGDAIVLPALIPVSTSCQWVPGETCYGVTNDGNSIWPLGMGIRTVEVLVRSGPNRLGGTQPTFFAFVVWNTTTVGRIFRIDAGTTAALNWNQALGNILAARTFSFLDTNGSSTGSTSGGPVPPPHPNVEGPVTFDSTYLDAVKRYGSVIQNATANFLATRAAGVD